MGGQIYRRACRRALLWAHRWVVGWICGWIYGRDRGRNDRWMALRVGRTTGVLVVGRTYVWRGGRVGGQAAGANERRADRRTEPWVFPCAERWAGVRSAGAMARRSDGWVVLRVDRSTFVSSDGRPEQWAFRCSGGWVGGRSAVSAGGPIGLSTNRAVGGRISGRACLGAGLPVVRSDTPTHDPTTFHRAGKATERSDHGTHEGSMKERAGVRIRQRLGMRSHHAMQRWVDPWPGQPLSGSVTGCPGGSHTRSSERTYGGSRDRQGDPANIRRHNGPYDVRSERRLTRRSSPPLPHRPPTRDTPDGQNTTPGTRVAARLPAPPSPDVRPPVPPGAQHRPPQRGRTGDRPPGRPRPPGPPGPHGRLPDVERADRTGRARKVASGRTGRSSGSGPVDTGVPDGRVRPRRHGWARAGADDSAEYGRRVRLLSRAGADPTSGCGRPNVAGTA